MRIGRYDLVEPLGSGGSSSTWLARDGDHEVALKLLDPSLPRELLRDEFSRLAGLVHPNVLRVLDYETVGARTFYTAERIEGAVWSPTSWRKDREIVIGLLRALAFLHDHGIRHGDVKADNVMVSNGDAVLIDLGCAAPAGKASATISGTLAFMAPEVKSASTADGRADMFSLGCLLQSVRGLPRTMERLAQRMRAAEPSDRPSAREALELLKVDHIRLVSFDAPRLLGRDDALSDFETKLDLLARGQSGPRVIGVEGDSGAGRSRLLREFKWRAQLRVNAQELRDIRLTLGETLGVRRDWARRIASLEPTVWLVDDVALRSQEERDALRALQRILPARGPLMLVLVGRSAQQADHIIPIGPLGIDDLRTWVGERAAAVLRLSGGYPREVRAVLGGSLEGESIDEVREARVAALPLPVRRVLGVIAALGHLPTHWLDPYAEHLGVLIGAGLIVRHRDRVALARPIERDALLQHATKRELRALAKRIPSTHVAEAIVCHVAAGDTNAAQKLGSRVEARGTPFDREAAEALVSIGESAHGARLFEALGDSVRAAELYREAGQSVRLGACLLRLERLDDARSALRGNKSADAADLLARIHIKLGQYSQALTLAENALHGTSDSKLRALLLEDVGVAASYLGDHERAETSLRAALEHAGAPRARVRVTSYLAIERWRRGDMQRAAELYAEALEIAETHELDDQLAPAAINSGSIHHHRGDWGRALNLYQRGLDGARLLGQATALATLSFNLAKLYADIGARARAQHWADELVGHNPGATLQAATKTVRAELVRDTSPESALALYEDARSTFLEAGAERELLEVDVGIAETRITAGHREEAQALLESLDASRFEDVRARVELLLAWLRNDVDGLRPVVESIRDRRDAYAEACGMLARLQRERGETRAAEVSAGEARRAWMEIADGLPDELREVFWQHPRRSALTPTTTASSADRGKLQRLLAINNKLSSSLDTGEVLHMAMDAAIELTGAERGFLVLREGDETRVQVARNLDRERIGRSHTKLSWNLAEQVLETGEPVLTVDARDDARFRDHVSVHAMKLRSVLAVPIPSPDGVRGALYLDNRFRRGRFSEEDVELLTAVADQLAIALRNAELLATLRARTQELEQQRERVEALSRGQAARIETLMAEVRSHRASAQRRFDYGQLIGRSDAMRRVLDTLDRVIDSQLAILVQGESGTGKELVARAVHTQGPRKDGPFVAINCAALPETLLESELFGHVRGAFTGATQDREGLMVAADGGTLFLDELGEIPLTTQAKLLRVLEAREVRPVGGRETREIDFRLVCATNRDLEHEVAAGRFRQDLFYRVGVVRVDLPPLRERIDDLPELCERLLQKQTPDAQLTAQAMQWILAYPWPGNVRQLANVLATAVVLAAGDTIEPEHLQLPEAPSKADAADQHEKDRLLDALRRFDWRVIDAADHLGMSRATLYRRMKRHGVAPKRRASVT